MTLASSDEERLKRFIKHVHKASKKTLERERARRELARKVERIKRLVSKKGVKKETIATAIGDFDDKLDEVLKKENRILIRQEKDEMLAEKFKKQLEVMRDSLSASSKYDVEVIEMLKNQIKGLETELRKEITDIKSKVSEVNDVRAKRIEELEEKIRKRVNKNYHELLSIEEHLKAMEQKYEFAKRAGVPEEKLGSLKQRMDMMKEKVGEKKAELEIPETGVPTGIPMMGLPEEKKAELKKPIMKQKPLIKHDMMFGEPPFAKKSIPFQEKFPEMPPMPKIPKLGPGIEGMPPPPPPPSGIKFAAPKKKKGFLSKLLGR